MLHSRCTHKKIHYFYYHSRHRRWWIVSICVHPQQQYHGTLFTRKIVVISQDNSDCITTTTMLDVSQWVNVFCGCRRNQRKVNTYIFCGGCSSSSALWQEKPKINNTYIYVYTWWARQDGRSEFVTFFCSSTVVVVVLLRCMPYCSLFLISTSRDLGRVQPPLSLYNNNDDGTTNECCYYFMQGAVFWSCYRHHVVLDGCIIYIYMDACADPAGGGKSCISYIYTSKYYIISI